MVLSLIIDFIKESRLRAEDMVMPHSLLTRNSLVGSCYLLQMIWN
jgi:hypothetical protein